MDKHDNEQISHMPAFGLPITSCSCTGSDEKAVHSHHEIPLIPSLQDHHNHTAHHANDSESVADNNDCSKVMSAFGENENVAYQYDVNDALRNNRPNGTKPLAEESKIKQDNKHESTASASIQVKSSTVSEKIPKMASSLHDFEVISTIGTGSYGICKKIRRKRDGKIMVWKEMEYGSMTESEKQMLVSEVNLLRELRHQHIVRYFDRIIDRSRCIIYIIMEYCQGGDLATIIGKNRKESSYVQEDFAWKILIQTTLALRECHRRKNGKAVLHRDLKPANVFLDAEVNVKLGDFGLARVLHHETSFAQTYVGTPYYMSPELVNNMSYNEKSDVWSLGCMLYELCALTPPFTASNQIELNRKIRIGDFPRLPSQYSLELDLIIRKMIQVEVSRRPSIDSILADPLVQKHQRVLDRRNGTRPRKSGEVLAERLSGDSSTDRKREELQAKMRQLDMKEKELESRERSLALREKLAEEKMKMALELIDGAKGSGVSTSGVQPALLRSPTQDESFSSSSCLSRGVKDPESPKKHVTFYDYLNGKENLRHKTGRSSYTGYSLNSYTGMYGRGDIHDMRREEVKDRLLYKARERAMGIGSRDLDSRITSRNLLFFR